MGIVSRTERSGGQHTEVGRRRSRVTSRPTRVAKKETPGRPETRGWGRIRSSAGELIHPLFPNSRLASRGLPLRSAPAAPWRLHKVRKSPWSSSMSTAKNCWVFLCPVCREPVSTWFWPRPPCVRPLEPALLAADTFSRSVPYRERVRGLRCFVSTAVCFEAVSLSALFLPMYDFTSGVWGQNGA